jgi:hypothetical protein
VKTRIINVSGNDDKYFGFIPPHGRVLDNNAYVEIDGDLRSALAAGRNRFGRSRELAALDAACAAGDICLVELAENCCSSSSSA